VSIQVINPLSDGRWDDLVARHPKASVFHGRGWLEALARTYSYTPFALTNAPEGKELTNGVVLCRVSSWITGTRAVSLPFADHCEPLIEDAASCAEFTDWLRAECDRQHWKYVELRALSWHGSAELQNGSSYWFHRLDLTHSLEQIFQGLHKDSIQRRIRRAERERLCYERGCSPQLMEEFYRLLLKTRRRHQMIPQPIAWFRNLIECLGDRVQIRVARTGNIPVAAILTLQHRTSVVYKYGCSDERYHHLAGMPFLFWRLIEESKAARAENVDFGRSDLDNKGLVTFKDRFGTSKRLLKYLRYSPTGKRDTASNWGLSGIRRLFSILPDAVLPSAGKILYRHIG
jgi:hypothetical protein